MFAREHSEEQRWVQVDFEFKESQTQASRWTAQSNASASVRLPDTRGSVGATQTVGQWRRAARSEPCLFLSACLDLAVAGTADAYVRLAGRGATLLHGAEIMSWGAFLAHTDFCFTAHMCARKLFSLLARRLVGSWPSPTD